MREWGCEDIFFFFLVGGQLGGVAGAGGQAGEITEGVVTDVEMELSAQILRR